jgi:phage terminase small subunit
MGKKLTSKQEMFCQEYLIDLNGAQAAIRAGYSANTAKDIACQNLAKLNIAHRITELKSNRIDSIAVNAKYVLNRLVEIDSLDVVDILDNTGAMKAIKDWPKSWRTSISGLDIQEMLGDDIMTVVKKIKWPDKLRNLELLGKHVDIKAWDGEQSGDNTPIQKVQIEVISAS